MSCVTFVCCTGCREAAESSSGAGDSWRGGCCLLLQKHQGGALGCVLTCVSMRAVCCSRHVASRRAGVPQCWCPYAPRRSAAVSDTVAYTSIGRMITLSALLASCCAPTGFVPVFKLDVVDTTGAGDAFTAGFVYKVCTCLQLSAQSLAWRVNGAPEGCCCVSGAMHCSYCLRHCTFLHCLDKLEHEASRVAAVQHSTSQ